MDLDLYSRLAALRIAFVMMVDMLGRDGKVGPEPLSELLEQFLSTLHADQSDAGLAMQEEMSTIIQSLRIKSTSTPTVVDGAV